MLAMHSRNRVLDVELGAIKSEAEEWARHLQIADTLDNIQEQLNANAERLDVIERQKVLRSLVKEVLAGDGEITIRHSMPMTAGNGCSVDKLSSHPARQVPESRGCLLRRAA